jgi:hypothetical protein
MSRMPMALKIAGSLLLAGSAAAASTNHVDGVRLVEHPHRIDVVIATRAAPTFQSTSQRSPAELVVDVLDATGAELTLPGPSRGPIEKVLFTVARSGAEPMGRVRVRLRRDARYDVMASATAVTLSIFEDAPAAARQAREDDPLRADTGAIKLAAHSPKGQASDAPQPRYAQARQEGAAGMATGEGPRAMTYVGFRNLAASSEIFARLTGPSQHEVRREGDNLLVLEVRNATIPLTNNKNHLDTTFFDSPVKMITPTEIDDARPTTRLIIEMKENVPYRTEVRGNEITIVFQKGG